jgi:hypothetical protein
MSAQRRLLPLKDFVSHFSWAVSPGFETNGAATSSISSKQCASFDHLVGGCEQRGRNVEAEQFRGPEINREFVFDRPLDRQISWLGGSEDAVDITRGLSELFREISAIGDQAA